LGLSLKESLKNVVEQKILGTYIIVVMEMKNPSAIYFAKNSGDLLMGVNQASQEVIVCSDREVFHAKNIWNHFTLVPIENNNILEVKKDCTYIFEKLEKKITIQRNPKAKFDHLMHEEIYGAVDAVDQATFYGGKFISNH
jgi:glucosamine 6-phosphate synthetase-like amidotransferase/phosphosugar isomerase protein